MFLSIGTVLLVSCYFIMTRMLAGLESTSTGQFWGADVPALMPSPLALLGWVWPDATPGFAVPVLIGAFGALSHIATTTAHRLANASIPAPVVYIEILLAAIADILVFDTRPTV